MAKLINFVLAYILAEIMEMASKAALEISKECIVCFSVSESLMDTHKKDFSKALTPEQD